MPLRADRQICMLVEALAAAATAAAVVKEAVAMCVLCPCLCCWLASTAVFVRVCFKRVWLTQERGSTSSQVHPSPDRALGFGSSKRRGQRVPITTTEQECLADPPKANTWPAAKPSLPWPSNRAADGKAGGRTHSCCELLSAWSFLSAFEESASFLRRQRRGIFSRDSIDRSIDPREQRFRVASSLLILILIRWPDALGVSCGGCWRAYTSKRGCRFTS